MATNVFQRFKQLLPASPLLIVTVDTVNPDGTSTVMTAAGGSMRVFGDGVTAGNKAFVKDGRIEDEAPDLPHFDVTV